MTHKRLRSLFAEVVLAGMALWLLAHAGTMVWDDFRLRSGSQVVRAEVIAKERPRSPRRTWSRGLEAAFFDWFLRGHPSNYVTYRFQLAGNHFLTEAPVRASLWRAVQEGSALDVQYLPSDPDVNRPAGESVLWLSLIRFAAGGCLALMIAGHTVIRLRERRSRSESPVAF